MKCLAFCAVEQSETVAVAASLAMAQQQQEDPWTGAQSWIVLMVQEAMVYLVLHSTFIISVTLL